MKRQITAGGLIIAAVYRSTLLAFRPLAPSHLLATFRGCQSKMAAAPSVDCYPYHDRVSPLGILYSLPEASLKRLVPLVSHLAVWEPLPSVSYWVLPEQTLVP